MWAGNPEQGGHIVHLTWTISTTILPSAQGHSILNFVTIGRVAFEMSKIVILGEPWVKSQTITLTTCFHKSSFTH